MVSLAGLAVTRFPAHRGPVADLRSAHLPGSADQREGALAQQLGGGGCVVRHQRTDVDGFIFIKNDPIEIRQAGDIDHGLDAFADTAFELEHQVGGTGDQAGFFPFFSQEAQCFFKGGGGDDILSTCCY